ncbi:MAG: hypothetical protein KBT36_08825 [Kurthia sp.]|nr:hypothetical protein [Candidatus Kurthia equi]
MTESEILTHPHWVDVTTYIKKGHDAFKRVVKAGYRHFYVLDNNEMSDLAELAKKNSHDFLLLMRSLSKPVFIIPTMVFEESVRNIKNQAHFNATYFPFYSMLATVGPILLMSTDDNFEVYAEGFTSKIEATDHYIELAKVSTHNLEIKNLLKQARTVRDVDDAYCSVLSDAGERFAFLYIHTLLAEQFTATFLSNEVKGVYYKWLKFSEDKQLLSKIYFKDSGSYIDAFRVISYHKLIFNFLRELTKNDPNFAVSAFLQNARSGSILQRPIRFGSEANIRKSIAPVYEGVENVKFNDMVGDNDIIMFY